MLKSVKLTLTVFAKFTMILSNYFRFKTIPEFFNYMYKYILKWIVERKHKEFFKYITFSYSGYTLTIKYIHVHCMCIFC